MRNHFLFFILSLAILTGKHCCKAAEDLAGLKFRVGELSDVSEVMGEDVMQLRKLLQTGKEVTDAELSDYVFDVLAKDGDLTAPGPEGLPPLMVAAHHGFTDILNTILDLGVDVNSRDKDGYTALMYAARGGHVATIKALISKEADVNLQGTKSGVTAIFLASNFGHGTALEVLIEAGGDVNLTSTQNTSPLLVATVGGHTAVVEILLENDADISIVAKTGDTAVLRAVQFDPKVEKAKANHVEIFKLLLEAGADPDTKKAPDGQSLIWIATFNGDTEVVKLLLADGVDLDSAAKDGTTPLFIAVQRCGLCVELLLEAGADPDPVYPQNGWTPLHFAAALGDLEACQMLVTYDADKTKKDSNGKLPFDIIGVLKPGLPSETIDLIKEVLQPDNVPVRGRVPRDGQRTRGAGFEAKYVLIIVLCIAALGSYALHKTCSNKCMKYKQGLDQSKAMISLSENSETSRDIERGQDDHARVHVVHYVLNPVYHEGPVRG